jgi:hypothetical protein
MMIKVFTNIKLSMIVVGSCAFLIRLAALIVLTGSDASGIYAYEHGEIAQNLIAGNGFSVRLLGTWGLTSQQAPLVPFLLAGCYAIFGVGTSAAHWLFLTIQCLEGALTAVGAMLLARQLACSPNLTLGVGLAVSVYPPMVYSVTHIQVAAVATMLLVWLFVALFMIHDAPTTRNSILAGLLMGFAALTDPILVLAGVAVTISWLWFDQSADTETRIKLLKSWSILVVVSLVTVSPWLVRGYSVHGRFVFVKSTFGYAFWQGNNRLSVGTDKVMRPSVRQKLAEEADSLHAMHERLWAARHEAGCIDDVALSVDDKKQLGKLPELERSQELMQRAKADLAAEHGRYFALCLRRLRFFLWIDESNPKTANMIYQTCQKSLSVMALSGFLIMGWPMRQRTSPIWLAFAMTTLFHALTITAPRFHLPWEPLLMVIGVCGLKRLTTLSLRPAWLPSFSGEKHVGPYASR